MVAWSQKRRLGREAARHGRHRAFPAGSAPDENPKLAVRPESLVPAHYAGAVTPWDLERCMTSSGNAFVDSRRTDAIEYAFRMKGDLAADLRKARHCLDEAIRELQSNMVER